MVSPHSVFQVQTEGTEGKYDDLTCHFKKVTWLLCETQITVAQGESSEAARVALLIRRMAAQTRWW